MPEKRGQRQAQAGGIGRHHHAGPRALPFVTRAAQRLAVNGDDIARAVAEWGRAGLRSRPAPARRPHPAPSDRSSGAPYGSVSCDGIACLSLRKPLKTCSFALPKAAISAQLVAPQSTATKPTTSSSQRSCRALSARGSGTSSKAVRKMSMRGSGSKRAIPTQESSSARTAVPLRSGQIPNAIPLFLKVSRRFSIPDDHIDPRRCAFFMARSVLGDIWEEHNARSTA